MSVITRTAAIAALLLASACSGQPEVLEPDPTATAKSPAADSAPSKPPAADEDSESGAANFALYWVEVSDFASLTGETAALKRISSKGCLGCKEYIDYYESVYSNGGRLTGGEQTLQDVSTRPSDDGDIILVRAKVDLEKGSVQETSKAAVETTAAESNRVVFRVKRQGEEWLMEEVALDD